MVALMYVCISLSQLTAVYLGADFHGVCCIPHVKKAIQCSGSELNTY